MPNKKLPFNPVFNGFSGGSNIVVYSTITIFSRSFTPLMKANRI